MPSQNSDEILVEYDEKVPRYEALKNAICSLLDVLVSEGTASPKIHEISGRVKKRDSLSKKILKPDKSYASLSELTDIAGARVTTYFTDDVDVVAEAVKRDFDIDPVNSIDKRATLRPDQFGYQSLHFVVSISEERLKLKEYQQFQGMKAEVQIRTILQHAWADIYHDIGYKPERNLPPKFKRRFSRLAGLLEIADAEFLRIRDEMTAFEEDPDEVSVDRVSLLAVVGDRGEVADADAKIAEILGCEVVQEPGYLDGLVGRLDAVELHTVGDVTRAMEANRDSVIALAQRLAQNQSEIMAGMSLFMLAYVLAANDRELLRSLVSSAPDGPEIDSLVDEIRSVVAPDAAS